MKEYLKFLKDLRLTYTDSLIERRDFLVSYQEGDEQEDSNGVPVGSASERAIEISIIEALLVALGVVILDNVTEDSPLLQIQFFL